MLAPNLNAITHTSSKRQAPGGKQLAKGQRLESFRGRFGQDGGGVVKSVGSAAAL